MRAGWGTGCIFQSAGVGAGEGGAEGEQSVLGVVAGADGFGEAGGTFGLQSGEEDGGLDLGGRDGGGEVDGVERSAVDGDGRVSIHQINFCSHITEWIADAIHRAEGEGGVSDKCEGVRVGGDEARQHAHGGAGVAAVEGRGGLKERAGDAGDLDGVIWVAEDGGTEGFHAGERGVGIGAGGEVGQTRCAFGEAGEHGVAMRDGLVAGNGEGALQGAGGADDLGGHSLSSVTVLRAVLDASREDGGEGWWRRSHS